VAAALSATFWTGGVAIAQISRVTVASQSTSPLPDEPPMTPYTASLVQGSELDQARLGRARSQALLGSDLLQLGEKTLGLYWLHKSAAQGDQVAVADLKRYEDSAATHSPDKSPAPQEQFQAQRQQLQQQIQKAGQFQQQQMLQQQPLQQPPVLQSQAGKRLPDEPPMSPAASELAQGALSSELAAARQGQVGAQKAVAKRFISIHEPTMALYWFRKAAAQGDAEAAQSAWYAALLESMKKNKEDEASALLGSPSATALADEPPMSPRAQAFFSKSGQMALILKKARGGKPFEQYDVGNAFMYHIEVPPDTASALYWYRKAAAQGYEPASQQLFRYEHHDEWAAQQKIQSDRAHQEQAKAQAEADAAAARRRAAENVIAADQKSRDEHIAPARPGSLIIRADCQDRNGSGELVDENLYIDVDNKYVRLGAGIITNQFRDGFYGVVATGIFADVMRSVVSGLADEPISKDADKVKQYVTIERGFIRFGVVGSNYFVYNRRESRLSVHNGESVSVIACAEAD